MKLNKQKLKPYLKYHRIVTLTIVFSYIGFMYLSSSSTNKYKNGQLKNEGRRENGYNVGRWIWYYENGQKQMEGYFEKGKREKLWKFWNNAGMLMSERNYENDKLSGKFIDYYQNGNKKAEGLYLLDNILGKITTYTENDSITKN